MTDSNVNRPFMKLSPALRTIGQVQSKGTLDYNGLLVKFQRRFANNFSFLNSYTYGKAIDLNSDNDGTVTLTNVYDPAVQPRAGRLRHHAHIHVELDLRAADRPQDKVYGGWQVSGIMLWRGGLPLTVTTTHGRAVHRDRQPSEPDLRRQHLEPDDRQMVRHELLRGADRH